MVLTSRWAYDGSGVGDDGCGATGKSSGASSRMPIVLADIWAYAQASAAAH
jgi:hypothetical protein